MTSDAEHPDRPDGPDPIEDRLADALDAYTDGVEPSRDAWGDIVGRLDAPRRRWSSPRWMVPGLAAAGLAALVVFFVLASGDGEEEEDSVVVDASELDRAIVAVTGDERLVELDGSGNEVREIVTLADVDRQLGFESDDTLTQADIDGAQQLAVSPDGADIYLARSDPTDACSRAAQIATAVVRVDADTGQAEGVGSPAYSPTVSDDGDVAFVTGFNADPSGSDGICAGAQEIAVFGEPVARGYTVPESLAVGTIDWLSSGSVLARTIPAPVEGMTYSEVVLEEGLVVGSFDVEPGSVVDTSLGDVVTIAGSADWDGFAFDHAVVHQPGVDPAAGVALDEWASLDFTYPADQAPLTVDADGDPGDILLVTAGESAGFPPATTLWIWDDTGDARPIADGVLAAVWGAPTEDPVPDVDEDEERTLPGSVLGIDGNGALVTYEPFGQRYTLSTEPFFRGAEISVADDGATFFVSGTEGDVVECDGVIHQGDLGAEDLSLQTIVQGGINASVSPDGRQLAYVALGPATGDRIDGCDRALVIRDLETGDERAWRDEGFPGEGDPGLAVLDNLRWSSDGDALAFEWSYEGSVAYVMRPGDAPGCAWLGSDVAMPFSDARAACSDVLEGYEASTPDGPGEHWSLLGYDEGGLVMRSSCYTPSCARFHEVMRFQAPPVAGPEATPRLLHSLPSDATEVVWSARYGMLYQAAHEPGPPSLYWAPPDGSEPVLVADDLTHAVWLD